MWSELQKQIIYQKSHNKSETFLCKIDFIASIKKLNVMEKNLILSANIVDIIFDGRNKSYGAYELRTNYSKRVFKSLFFTSIVLFTLIFIFGFKNETSEIKTKYTTTEVTITEINEPQKPPPPPPPPKEVQTTQTSVVKYTTPIIVDNPTDPPPAQTDIRDAEIGTINRKGDTCQVKPLPQDIGGNGIETQEPEIFEKVEIEATFPGGEQKWRQYLERTLGGTNPADNGAPEGVYKTIVQFVVDVDGSISDVKALTDFGYGIEQAAIKTIKKGPKWNPAIQNGRAVKAYRKQMITFQVLSE